MKKVWTKAALSNEVTKRELEHRELARQIAAEGIVLLANDGTLPLKAGSIALFGAGAAFTIKGGTGSGEVNGRYTVMIWEGLKNAGFTVTTESWLNEYLSALDSEKEKYYKQLFKKLQKALLGGDETMINIMSDAFHYPVGRVITEADITKSNTETCIYVISRQAGECSDRKFENYEYTLEPDEINNIRICAVKYKKTVLAVNIGSSIDLSPLDEIEGINAVIYFCQQGMEGGNAFADVVTGKTPPSGCLTNTWAKKYDDLPFAGEYSYLKGAIDKEYYKEGIYVGYRYFDSFNAAPRYEFGYGLTYSDFTIECAGIDTQKSSVTVTAKVTNTGKSYSGKKTVQLYVSCPDGEIKREYQSLAAFAKTKVLAPGESESLTLAFDLTDLAGYKESSSAYILEAGEYIIRLGSSSRKTQVVGVVSLDETVVTEQCEKVCPLQNKLEELTCASKAEIPSGVKRVFVKASDIKTQTHDYKTIRQTNNPKAEKWMALLSKEDRLKFLLGAGMAGAGFFNVPGNAAVTTSDFTGKGIVNISLADGQAGLRLQSVSVIKKSGVIKMVEPMMEMFRYTNAFFKKYMFGTPEQGQVVYQYATAFPIGTAIAQTWNTEIMEAFGKAVGTEMLEYGVTFWLAPGMNIQRNPLCGRNYEYYSEDPVLTGKTAAAVTRGVQSHSGCYVTLKHYAANNQEQLRNHSDSVIGERTLREIYLKGFKIAVKEGAKGVMTSYNLLNGTYTADNFDLCTKLLRQEWGFDGVVMTDWFSSGKGMANNGLAIKAGNDLIMPGGKKYLKMLKKDIKLGKVSDEEINRSCARVLTAIAESDTQKEFEKRGMGSRVV
ncbi:MAG: glycoside hydrolase family 3 C-terminal domain-containing protein [Treponema sp.]|jgi:beta-glucosidase|nr:glycoside hydrolase family 3 C-terminal domain-containing protein [Treponema sp.]